MRILSIGELLWDVFPGKEFLGGAPLNFSLAAQRLGNSVAFITAVGADERGTFAIRSMDALSLTAKFVQVIPGQHTGTAVVTADGAGDAAFAIKRPAAFDFLHLDAPLLSEIGSFRPDWIYFGTLAQTNPRNEDLLYSLIARIPDARCFYDMNLRDSHWDLSLVQRLSRLASIVKLNEGEAETLFRLTCNSERFSLEDFCRQWSSTYGGNVICITLGNRGCAIWRDGVFETFNGFSVKVVDTVGAGDAFGAAFLHGHQIGWPIEHTASFANALGALVASRAGATPVWTTDECLQLMASR